MGEASKNSTDEVKRLSGSISTKDIELDSLRSDLTSLSTQLNQLKEVIDQPESEAQDKENQLLSEHKLNMADMEDKLKKSVSAKDKAEKSKEETVQSFNDKIKTLKETHPC